MQDRVPVNPGRVLIKPENGSASYYATLTRADNPTQEGTPLNKSSLLKDATAALFGLGTNAVPDDVFEYLGQYAKHYWRRRSVVYDVFTESDPVVTNLGSGETNAEVFTVWYSDSVTCTREGRTLTNPKTLSVSYDTYTEANKLKGMYFSRYSENSDYPIYFCPATAANATRTITSNIRYVKIAFASINYKWEFGPEEIVSSVERNAYPDRGESGGYEWGYFGVPFENAKFSTKIATGSYTGTGTCGESNPTRIAFDFVPKIVVIVSEINIAFYVTGSPRINFFSARQGSPSNSTYSWYLTGVTLDGTVLTFYHTSSADAQFNDASNVYHYFAIG